MTETILIVEDEKDMRKHVSKILLLEGYNVIETKNGIEALSILNDGKKIDLVISDIMMAEMSGLDLFHEFKKHSEYINIPFVFLTAKTHSADIEAAQSQGVDAYITKPFEVTNLISIVKGKIQKAKRTKEIQDKTIDDINNRLLMTFSHEFRTPLTLIIAYAEMLNDWDEEMSNQETETFFEGVRTGAQRMNRLVEKIVLLIELLTKEGSKKCRQWGRNVPPYDLENFIGQAINRVQDENLTANILVEGEIQSSVYGYDEYLVRVFYEIIENGIKFSQDKQLLINISEAELALSISFRNKADKIPEEELEKLNKPFYQYNREHYEFQGIGAGLAIAKGICKLHSAKLNVTQNQGYFVATITFPFQSSFPKSC